jgi:hypothetical protein
MPQELLSRPSLFILCRVCIMCVDLCAVFRLIVVLFRVMCVISYCSTTATGLKPICSQNK